MSSVGFGLLKSFVQEEIPPQNWQVNESYFNDKEKVAYTFIVEYFQQYNRFPELETVKIEIDQPTCFQHLTGEPSEFWLEKVAERKRHNLSNSGITAIHEKLQEEDVDGAVDEFNNAYCRLKETYPVAETSNEDDRLAFPDSCISGLAGDFARLYAEHLESAVEFFYFNYLTCLGAVLSDRVTLQSEITPQPRLFTINIGQSADSRKSTALSKTLDFFQRTFPMSQEEGHWGGTGFYICNGAGSAEGLQRALGRNNRKVLLALDELAPFVSKCKIQNSALLPCTNTLFENNNYENITSKSRILIENAHLSLIGCCTIPTWEEIWTSKFMSIGFLNRLLLVPGRSERRFSIPPTIPEEEKQTLSRSLRDMVRDNYSNHRRLSITRDAMQRFDEWYLNLPRSVHSKRLDQIALRTMILLCINDGKAEVDLQIVEKSISISDWQYKVRCLYDPVSADNQIAHCEERIRRCLALRPMTKRDIQRKINANRLGLWVFNTALKNLRSNEEVVKRSSQWVLVAN